MKDADLYVFDEPPANVDAPSKAKIISLMARQARGLADGLAKHESGSP